MTESIKMTGYKATKADMSCQPDKNKPAFQFEMGVWYEVEGEIEECKNGFHFCEHPSGVWSYYSDADARVFKIEAEEVLPKKSSPGADRKRVCRRIRLTEEMTFRNPSNRNTGDYNSGDYNSGYRNTGDYNTGNDNSGDYNSGYRNSGYYNATNFSAGFFCVEEPLVVCFDVQTNLTRSSFFNTYPEYQKLGKELSQDAEIDFAPYANLPGITL